MIFSFGRERGPMYCLRTDGRPDGRTTDKMVLHKLNSSLTVFKPFCLNFDFNIKDKKHNRHFSLINNKEFIYIMTLNSRKCLNASKCLLRNGTESKSISSYILLDHFNAFGLSRNIFLSQTTSKGVRNFRLCPLLSPKRNLPGPNWHIAHLHHVSHKIRL